MVNEAAAHREYAEKLAEKHACRCSAHDFCETDETGVVHAQAAIDEAVRTALEKAAQAVMPDDFDKGSSEWCALCAVQAAIRSIVLRAEDVREKG